MHLNNTLFLAINFTLHLISRTLKLKRPALLVKAAAAPCWPIQKDGSLLGERIFDLHSQ